MRLDSGVANLVWRHKPNLLSICVSVCVLHMPAPHGLGFALGLRVHLTLGIGHFYKALNNSHSHSFTIDTVDFIYTYMNMWTLVFIFVI